MSPLISEEEMYTMDSGDESEDENISTKMLDCFSEVNRFSDDKKKP